MLPNDQEGERNFKFVTKGSLYAREGVRPNVVVRQCCGIAGYRKQHIGAGAMGALVLGCILIIVMIAVSSSGGGKKRFRLEIGRGFG